MKKLYPSQINVLIIGGYFLAIYIADKLNSEYGVLAIDLIIRIPATIWVFIDAKKLNIGKYKPTFFGRGPISYAVTVLFIWWLALPLYIIRREHVIEGRIMLKQKGSKE